MKVKSIDGQLVQWPGIAGVYVGATVERKEVKDASGKVIDVKMVPTFTADPVELRGENETLQEWTYARIRDNSLPYWMRKVKEGELEVADEEMAKLCGKPWQPRVAPPAAEPVAPSPPAPSKKTPAPEAAAAKG